MPTMRIARSCYARCCALAILALLLAACAGEPRRNIFPPKASIQQLALRADGSWTLQLRLQNFSEAAMTFAKIEAKIEIAGVEAGRVNVAPAIRVSPASADLFETGLVPMPAAAAKVAALRADDNVRYRISGRIATREPSGDYEFSYESRLSPVPGLAGVLR
jgi:hypothetical protein